MSEMIAYCGLDCLKCNAFQVTREMDLERRKRLAEKWSEEKSIAFTPEDIDCDGCSSTRVSGWCRKICEIRPCAEHRKVITCAHCVDYPCFNLKTFLSKEPEAMENLDKIRKSI